LHPNGLWGQILKENDMVRPQKYRALIPLRMMRSNFVITRDGDNHELMQQYWVASDGSGREWLAVQYDCKRRH
jgi:hypothetical protein